MDLMSTIIRIAMVIAGIGAINWGLKIYNINAVSMVAGGDSKIETFIYYLVAISGLISVIGSLFPH